MKKRTQGFLLGVILTFLFSLSMGMIDADQLSKKVDIVFNNIKIFIDGKEIIAKDGAGNTVEPFIYNGTTYLPVRAVANAFKKEVQWDGATQSVYIGKKDQTKPDTYLHKLQYNGYENRGEGEMTIINGIVRDLTENEYNNGLIFKLDGYHTYDDKSSARIYYPLNSQFKKMSGRFLLPSYVDVKGWTKSKINDGGERASLRIFGDDKLLYEAKNVGSEITFDFEVDVKGVNQLKIVLYKESVSLWRSYVALTDLALFK